MRSSQARARSMRRALRPAVAAEAEHRQQAGGRRWASARCAAPPAGSPARSCPRTGGCSGRSGPPGRGGRCGGRAGPARRTTRHSGCVSTMPPGRGPVEAGDAVEHRRLAGAVRADDGGDLAPPRLRSDSALTAVRPPKRMVRPRRPGRRDPVTRRYPRPSRHHFGRDLAAARPAPRSACGRTPGRAGAAPSSAPWRRRRSACGSPSQVRGTSLATPADHARGRPAPRRAGCRGRPARRWPARSRSR